MDFMTFVLYVVALMLASIVFGVINAVLLRELSVFFELYDQSLATASAIAIWLTLAFMVATLSSSVPFLFWTLMILVQLFVIFLIRTYYSEDYKTCVLVWELWLGCYLFISMLIFFFTQSGLRTGYFLILALLSLILNVLYASFMRKLYYRKFFSLPVVLALYLVMNGLWLFPVYIVISSL